MPELLLIYQNRLPEMITGALGSFKELNINAAKGIANALDMISGHDYDLILCQSSLPEISDTDLLGKISQLEPDVPIILYSGPANCSYIRSAWHNGAFDYLPKPLNPEKLIDSIERALRIKSVWDEKKRVESESRTILNQLKDLAFMRPDFFSEEDEKYRSMHEAMLTGVLYLDNQEKVTAANPAAERLTGISFRDMEGKSLSALLYKPLHHNGKPFHIDDLPSRQVLRTGKAISNVVIGLRTRKRKRYHWAVVNTVPQFRPHEKYPFRILLSFDDITYLKETEDALLRSEQKNLAILNALPDMMLLLGKDEIVRDVKNTGGSFFTREVKPGDNLADVSPASFCELTRHFMKQAQSSQQIQKFDYQLTHHGELKHFEIRMISSGPHDVLSIIRNITEQKRFEIDLQKSENKFRILLESASQAIVLVDIHGQIVLVNVQLERIFGYDREELIHQPIEILIPAALRDSHTMKRSAYLTHPATRDMAGGLNISARRKDGGEFPVEVSLSAIEIYEGVFVMAFITDISERRKLESRIRQVEKLEAIGQLAGGIAHDFNNVLAGIMGLSELALRKISPDNPAVETLNIIVKKSESAANLVRQLLTFSRQQIITTRPVNLNHSIRNNYKLLQRYLGEDIKLIAKLAEDLPLINADLTAIDQIITNLCINARDAMPDGGELLIETSPVLLEAPQVTHIGEMPARLYVKLTVADTGIGMRQEVLKHIFEPFFTTKDIGEGTGLGLSIIYGLVKQHNAFIQCESSPGEGARFDLYFNAVEEKEIAQPANRPEKIKGGSETILVAEDETDLIRGYKDALESAGYRVLTASNGFYALDLFQENYQEIKLIISDLIMPSMGGIELQLRVRQMKPETKFLFISAYNDKIPDESNYLPKPFPTKVLLRKVRELLDQSG
jgi:PAS domain S-box-containing protein